MNWGGWLRQFRKNRPSITSNWIRWQAATRVLDLRAIKLPPGERATRAAVAKTTEHELLFSSGKEFEFNLLLTQVEALSYGRHLANIAAENSSLPDEVQAFKVMSQAMKTLYDQVIGQMHRNN